MLSEDQWEKCRQFIYRHGRLLDRKRYAYHFEGGDRESVLDVLACYQNADGGFGNGLELDVMCPQSSPICTEVGLSILVECGAGDSAIADRAEGWIVAGQREDGTLAHPEDAIRAYPHGGWWLGDDDLRIFSLAGRLGGLGRGTEEFYARVAALFRASYSPFPTELGVYMYPLHVYLNHARGADSFAAERAALQRLLPSMLSKEAWHCPLFFCHDQWHSKAITDEMWREEAAKAVGTLGSDGGVTITRYAKMPWWRPVWTLEMLITLNRQGLLNATREPSVPGDA